MNNSFGTKNTFGIKNNYARFISFLLSLVIILGLFSVNDIDTAADSKSSKNNAWADVYFQFINDHFNDGLEESTASKEDGISFNENYTYDIIYVDNDDIPEILVSGPDEASGMGVISYCNGKATYQAIGRHGFCYIERSGLILEDTGVMGSFWTNVYSLKNGSFTVLGSGEYNEYYDDDLDYVSYEYYWEGESVSEDEYNAEIDKLFDRSKITNIGDVSSLKYNSLQLFDCIARLGVDYSDVEWVRAYQSFLVNKDYVDANKGFYEDTEVLGYFFDMDKDGIPELILTGRNSGDSIEQGYIYTSTGGKVGYIGNGPECIYLDCHKYYDGSIYGFEGDDSFNGELSEYKKQGKEVVSEVVKVYDGDTYIGSRYDDDYVFTSFLTINSLLSELHVFDQLHDDYVNPAAQTAEIDDLLGGLGWTSWKGDFNYKTADYENCFSYQFLDDLLIDLRRYPGKIIIDNPEESANYDENIKNDVPYVNRMFDGKGMDWVLQNIYNISDSNIEALHQYKTESFCYKNGFYYSGAGGVGGGFGAYLKDIEDMGGVYHVTYYEINISDGPFVITYEKRYALVANKVIDGKSYWSIYRTSTSPLYDEVDDIDVGIKLSDKYAPYPIVALKSVSTGCYVTCDIGAKDKSGQYPKVDKPDYNVTKRSIRDYEKFYQVPLSNGKCAFQMFNTMKYMAVSGVYMDVADFAEGKAHCEIIDEDGYKRIKCNGTWLGVSDGHLAAVRLKSMSDKFEIVTVDENQYNDYEKNILSNGEWFNLDGNYKGGYWTIQSEIGRDKESFDSRENVKTLKDTLHYTMMYRKDRKRSGKTNTIEYGNMECAIGVKKKNGKYDVIITFQGTGGYNDNTTTDDPGESFVAGFENTAADAIANIENNPVPSGTNGTCDVYVHSGYKKMADKLVKNNEKYANGRYPSSQVVTKFKDGETISLAELIQKAKNGQAKFTILGHSMGGAIAQCYALYLTDCGVSPYLIKGRTFNSALAIAKDDKDFGSRFTDWYNLCVTSDSVPRGLVTGSINHYGINRIGKTIWLYDDESDNCLSPIRADNSVVAKLTSNILASKHNMGRKLFDVLMDTTYNTITGYSKVPDMLVFATNKDDVPVRKRPKADSDVKERISNAYTTVDVNAYAYNDKGHMWCRTKDRKFIYSENLTAYMKTQVKSIFNPAFYVNTNNAPVRSGFSSKCDVICKLNKGDYVDIDYGVQNDYGNLWYHIKTEDGGGWIYSEKIQQTYIRDKKKEKNKVKKLVAVDCPVNVSLFDSEGNDIAGIKDGELSTKDHKRVWPIEVGEGKYFEIYDDEEYTVKIDTLASGMMDYYVYSDYDETIGEYAVKKNYTGVTISENGKMESDVGGSVSMDDLELRVMDDSGKKIDVVNDDSVKNVSVLDRIRDSYMYVIIIIGVIVLLSVLIAIIIIAVIRKKKKTNDNSRNVPVYCSCCGAPLNSVQLFCENCGTRRV